MNSLVCDSSRSARAPERWHIVRAAIRDGERVGTRYASEGAPRSITMGRTRMEDMEKSSSKAFEPRRNVLLVKMTLVCGRADLEDGAEGLCEEGADTLEAG